MNIDDYRAMIAQEKTQSQEKTEEVVETKPAEEKKIVDETKIPEKIEIDGIGEVTLEELKNGYLRTSDYTKKTQDVANQRRENEEAIKLMQELKRNPTVAQEMSTKLPNMQQLDPAQAKIMELENKVYDMLLVQEINELKSKYEDFDAKTVLEIANEKKLYNLEDAYKLSKSVKTSEETKTVDTDKIREELRAEILKELASEKNTTRTIITTNSETADIKDDKPKMTDEEKRVARKMRVSDEEYIKWRNIK